MGAPSRKRTSILYVPKPEEQYHIRKCFAHIYADRAPKDQQRAKKAPKIDLQYERWWSILSDWAIADDGDLISALNVGFLLLCGSTIVIEGLIEGLIEGI